MINFSYRPDEIEITQKAIKIGSLIIEHAEMARHEGLLSLEELMEYRDNEIFLKEPKLNDLENKIYGMLLGLVMEGNSACIIESAAKYLLNTLNPSEKENRFNIMLMAEGILMIQAGENPRSVAVILSSMMGLKTGKEFLEEVGIKIYS